MDAWRMTNNPRRLAAEIATLEAEDSGGSGSSFGTYSDVVVGDYVQLPFDGRQSSVPCITTPPPSWLDGSGNIIAPGLYAAGATFTLAVNPTTSGLYFYLSAAFNHGDVFPCDPLASFQPSDVGLESSQGLGSDDLPWPAGFAVRVPTDDTGILRVFPYVVRLAY